MSTKPHKILVLTSAFPPHVFGGGEVAAFNMVKLLISRGYDVSVATLHEKDAEIAWGKRMQEGYTLYRLKLPRTHTFYSRNEVSAGWKKLLWHIQDYIDPRNVTLIRKLLAAVNPDHVDIHNIAGIGFNVLSALEKAGCSVTYFLHDLNLVCFHGSMYKNDENCTGQCKSCRVFGNIRQYHLQKITKLGFISPSQGNLNKVVEFAPVVKNARTAVIRNVPDELPDLPVKMKSETIRLLFVGRLDPIKGIEFLIEVLSNMIQDFKFHLTVLGTGPLEKPLRERYQNCSWLDIRGFVSRTEVAKAMAEADLFCMTSLWAETYGIVTAQSLQTGTPVIGSNIGGTTELVRNGETGILVEPGNSEAWKAAFASIFQNPAILDEWQANTLKYKHEFDEDHIGALYDDFVESVHQVEEA